MEDIYKEQARLRQLSKLKYVKDHLPSLGPNDHNDNVNKKIQSLKEDGEGEEKDRVVEVISKSHGLSPKTYQRAKTIIENGSEEVKEKLRLGRTTISKESEKIQRDRKRSELLFQIIQSDSFNINEDDKNSCNTNYKLIYGDFIEQSQKEILDNSVDLIFTDPPYGKEYLSFYKN